MVRSVFLMMLAGCGQNDSQVQSFRTNTGISLYVKKKFDDFYCVYWQTNDKVKLLTTSGVIAKYQLREAFRSDYDLESASNWAVIGLTITLAGRVSQQPAVVFAAMSGTALAVLFFITDSVYGVRNTNLLIADVASPISVREMDRVVPRISSQTSHLPGSCDEL